MSETDEERGRAWRIEREVELCKQSMEGPIDDEADLDIRIGALVRERERWAADAEKYMHERNENRALLNAEASHLLLTQAELEKAREQIEWLRAELAQSKAEVERMRALLVQTRACDRGKWVWGSVYVSKLLATSAKAGAESVVDYELQGLRKSLLDALAAAGREGRETT